MLKTVTTDYTKFCVGMPVVRTDGGAVGVQSRDYKCSRMGSLPHFLSHGAPLLIE